MTYKRPIYSKVLERFQAPRHFIQVLAGPRQVGKTTLMQQLIQGLNIPNHYASADSAQAQMPVWIEQQWQTLRLKLRQTGASSGLLALDEIQNIPNWSAEVKRLWDEDTIQGIDIKLGLLGSAQLLLQQGLTESLAGRFELIPITHWSYLEMQQAFHCTLEEFIFFGGYPGAYVLRQDEQRWVNYVNDALIETTVSRDILQMVRVDKPALLRRLFLLACHYSGQILSFQKMIGQLQDVGNTTTLAHYLELLKNAGLVCGLDKFAGQLVRQKGSSPKLQVLNTALLSASSGTSFKQVLENPELWGRWVESAIAAHLLNNSLQTGISIKYWRDKNQEVDFILQHGKKIIAIEVKTSRNSETLSGMQKFDNLFHPDKCLLVGGQGIAIEDFLKLNIMDLFE